MLDHFPAQGAAWEVYVVYYDAPDVSRSDLVFRLHHAIGDGVTLAAFLIGLCEPIPLTPAEEAEAAALSARSEARKAARRAARRWYAAAFFCLVEVLLGVNGGVVWR